MTQSGHGLLRCEVPLMTKSRYSVDGSHLIDLRSAGPNMLDRIVDSLSDAIPQLFSTDAPHHDILRGFGVFLAILLALFLLSYIRSFFSSSDKRGKQS